VNIDVDIDGIDTTLLLPVKQALTPRPILHLRILDLREKQAFPLAASRMPFAAGAADLIRQNLLFVPEWPRMMGQSSRG